MTGPESDDCLVNSGQRGLEECGYVWEMQEIPQIPRLRNWSALFFQLTLREDHNLLNLYR